MKVLLGERIDELISANLITCDRLTSALERASAARRPPRQQARVRLTRLSDEIYLEIKRARPPALRHVSHGSSSDQTDLSCCCGDWRLRGRRPRLRLDSLVL